TRIAPHGASAGSVDPFWFMNRTKRPSRNSGSHAGEPELRFSVIERQMRLANGGPLHKAPAIGSPIVSNSSADLSEFRAPRLRPCRYRRGRLSLGSVVQ